MTVLQVKPCNHFAMESKIIILHQRELMIFSFVEKRKKVILIFMIYCLYLKKIELEHFHVPDIFVNKLGIGDYG